MNNESLDWLNWAAKEVSTYDLPTGKSHLFHFFPDQTEVVIIDNNDGYFIRRVDSRDMLDIRFDTLDEVIEHALDNNLVIVCTSGS